MMDEKGETKINYSQAATPVSTLEEKESCATGRLSVMHNLNAGSPMFPRSAKVGTGFPVTIS